jgi:hypothetical protein
VAREKYYSAFIDEMRTRASSIYIVAKSGVIGNVDD